MTPLGEGVTPLGEGVTPLGEEEAAAARAAGMADGGSELSSWEAVAIPRTEAELASFKRALKVMGNLYGSLWATTVLRAKEVPPRPAGFVGEYNPMPYDDRGWPSFERFAAELAVAHRLADSHFSHTEVHRPKLIDLSSTADPKPERLAMPPTTSAMVSHLRQVHFTGGKGDQDACMRMLNTFATTLRSEVDLSEAIGGERNKQLAKALADRKSRFDESARVRRVAAAVYGVRLRVLRLLHNLALGVVPRAASAFHSALGGPSTDNLASALETITTLQSRSSSARTPASLRRQESQEPRSGASTPRAPPSEQAADPSADPAEEPHGQGQGQQGSSRGSSAKVVPT